MTANANSSGLKPLGIDLGWFYIYNNVINAVRDVEARLRQRKLARGDLFRDIAGPNPSLRNYFILLEQIVLNDALIVDASAMERLGWKLPNFTDGLVKPVIPDPGVYLSAEDRAFKAVIEATKLAEAGSASANRLIQLLRDRNEYHAFFVAWEKRLHDEWFNAAMRDHAKVPQSFAESSNHIGRTFFYLELGKALNADLMLSPGKQEWLTLLGEALNANNVKSAHDTIAKTVGDKVLSLAKREVGEFGVAETAYMPPITALIAKLAFKERATFEEAAVTIRASRQATAYRKLVHGIRTGLLSADEAERGEAAKQVREIEAIAKLWQRDGVSETAGYCVKWKRTTLKALGDAWIPALGTAGMAIMEGLGATLSPRTKAEPHIAFMASWYKTEGLEVSDPRETRRPGMWET